MSIGFGDALSLVSLGLDLLAKTEAAGEQFTFMHLRMTNIQQQLHRAKFIASNNKEESQIQKLAPELFIQARHCIDRLKEDLKKVEDILTKWANGEFGLGKDITLKYKKVSDFVNGVLKGGGDKLESLNERLGEHRDFLRDCVNDMNAAGIRELLKLATAAQAGGGGVQAPLKPIPATQHPHKKSPSPGPKQPAKLIFVDTHNVGRSVLAQSYVHLLEKWTLLTKNKWPVKTVASAGILVQHRAAYAKQISALLLQGPFKNLRKGNVPPTRSAIDALFLQKYFDYTYKPPIYKKAKERHSRGLPLDVFSGYDVILCFTNLEKQLLESLRDALDKTAPAWKKQNKRAKILLLGEFGGHAAAEIKEPLWDAGIAGKEGKATKYDKAEWEKGRWGAVVGNVKGCVKRFLEKECAWKVPGKEAGAMQGEKLKEGWMKEV